MAATHNFGMPKVLRDGVRLHHSDAGSGPLGFGHLLAFWPSDVTALIIGEFLARHVPVRAPAHI